MNWNNVVKESFYPAAQDSNPVSGSRESEALTTAPLRYNCSYLALHEMFANVDFVKAIKDNYFMMRNRSCLS